MASFFYNAIRHFMTARTNNIRKQEKICFMQYTGRKRANFGNTFSRKNYIFCEILGKYYLQQQHDNSYTWAHLTNPLQSKGSGNSPSAAHFPSVPTTRLVKMAASVVGGEGSLLLLPAAGTGSSVVRVGRRDCEQTLRPLFRPVSRYCPSGIPVTYRWIQIWIKKHKKTVQAKKIALRMKNLRNIKGAQVWDFR
jgi:hypothetical protein